MKLKKIIIFHGKLAERIKQFETALNTYPPIEVSNEIRYALRAVIEILEINNINEKTQENKDDLELAKQKAYHALICAYHDLIDGLTIHVTITLDELRNEYLEESIVILGSKRTEIIDFINIINEKIALSRKNPEERIKIYDEILYDQYFSKLIEYRKLLTGRLIEDIVELHLKNKTKTKNNNNKFSITIILSLIGLILILIKMLLSYS